MLQAFAFAFTVLLIAALSLALIRALEQVDQLKDKNRELAWEAMAARAGLEEARQFVAGLTVPRTDDPVIVLNGDTLMGYREHYVTEPPCTYYEWTN